MQCSSLVTDLGGGGHEIVGKNLALYVSMPRNDCNSCLMVGGGASSTVLFLLLVGLIPSADMICPKNSNWLWKN